MNVINIGSRREFFFDEFLIETDKTTAELKLHEPQVKEVVIKHDELWEGDGCNFHNIIKDDDIYRMYYLGWEMLNKNEKTHSIETVVCYCESRDGKTWTKPNLGICEFNDSYDNNIILNQQTAKFDNFLVFKDTNPDCKKDELYKGVSLDWKDRTLWCYTSRDGKNFKKAWIMTDEGTFDTLNIAFYDENREEYVCYIRDFHYSDENNPYTGIRDVRWMVSKDFKKWSTPKQLDFNGADDYPLYTNAIQKYYRGQHMYVGFPSRYVERKEWTDNFEQLPDVENRRFRMDIKPRYGLTVTDCIFMSSRDGEKWKRWDEAFLKPGPERARNWVYGDCFPAVGMIETKNDLEYADNEISLFTYDNHWSMKPANLRRYTIRIDGFVSYNSKYKQSKIITKPFIFKGKNLSINFATSAIGYAYIKIIKGNSEYTSVELFGDNIKRDVNFENCDLEELSGKPIIMEITMSDADIYSFKFE